MLSPQMPKWGVQVQGLRVRLTVCCSISCIPSEWARRKPSRTRWLLRSSASSPPGGKRKLRISGRRSLALVGTPISSTACSKLAKKSSAALPLSCHWCTHEGRGPLPCNCTPSANARALGTSETSPTNARPSSQTRRVGQRTTRAGSIPAGTGSSAWINHQSAPSGGVFRRPTL